MRHAYTIMVINIVSVDTNAACEGNFPGTAEPVLIVCIDTGSIQDQL